MGGVWLDLDAPAQQGGRYLWPDRTIYYRRASGANAWFQEAWINVVTCAWNTQAAAMAGEEPVIAFRGGIFARPRSDEPPRDVREQRVAGDIHCAFDPRLAVVSAPEHQGGTPRYGQQPHVVAPVERNVDEMIDEVLVEPRVIPVQELGLIQEPRLFVGNAKEPRSSASTDPWAQPPSR